MLQNSVVRRNLICPSSLPSSEVDPGEEFCEPLSEEELEDEFDKNEEVGFKSDKAVDTKDNDGVTPETMDMP